MQLICLKNNNNKNKFQISFPSLSLHTLHIKFHERLIIWHQLRWPLPNGPDWPNCKLMRLGLYLNLCKIQVILDPGQVHGWTTLPSRRLLYHGSGQVLVKVKLTLSARGWQQGGSCSDLGRPDSNPNGCPILDLPRHGFMGCHSKLNSYQKPNPT